MKPQWSSEAVPNNNGGVQNNLPGVIVLQVIIQRFVISQIAVTTRASHKRFL
jgi:hypothetical protein